MQHPAYDIKTILDFNNPNFSRLLALFCYFSIPIITDPAVHRVIVAKDYKQTRKALLLTALCLVVVKLSIVAGVLWMSVSCEPIKSISLFSFVLHSRIPDIWWLVLHIFTSRTFNRMNVVTLLLVEDNRSLFHRLNLKISSISRFVAFVVGAISITLALSECDLLELVIIAHSFYYTTIMPVFLLTIFGLRFTKERVLTAIITAFLCVVIWQQFGVVFNCISINLSSILLGIMANLIILLCPDIFAKPFLTKISLNQKN
ncbi:MAG TPA: hypothetical protein QKA08_01415 [Candidatus Megaira endosymbiont of Nemacystus decipiens]|nr:hypothetical protein [Candidatus Megaera endosymbiont of Nemacystus decipiens]